jgi:hypothetical protein
MLLCPLCFAPAAAQRVEIVKKKIKATTVLTIM